MKKNLSTLLLALVTIATTAQAQVILNETNFPDANFRAALASRFWISEGDEITDEMIAATTSLYVSRKSIADLMGIEHFTALSSLDCSYNRLTSLDVSKNTALTFLNCGSNQLTALDVSNNAMLTTLYCSSNQLTLLDVSQNTELETLECTYNQLSSLDVSKNTALTRLECNRNQLTSLEVSGCTALTKLECYFNELTSLDVSKNTALTRLECNRNQLTSLDVSQNTALVTLYCSYNQLTSLDVLQNTVLETFSCGNNQLTSLDVSKNAALKEWYCDSNQFTLLDVSQNTALTTLDCGHNQLTSLDVSNNTALTTLACDNNQLTSLDVSKNTALETLWCFSNQIKGEAMDELVTSLPTVENGYFFVINTKDENEGNVCKKKQVAAVKEKGWKAYDKSNIYDWYYTVGGYRDVWRRSDIYEGSDEELFLDEENFPDDNFRTALAKDLGIAEGDEINTGLIVATTKIDVSNGKITMLSGIEYFTALTTIYCQSNMISGNAIKGLIAALPDLSSNGAKGMMFAEETNPRAGALYALDFTDENEQNVCTAEHVAAANEKGWTVYCKTAKGWQEYDGEVPTGIHSIDNGKLTIDNWYSVDGVKLQGEPMRKGVYIVNGRKVVK